MKLEPTYSHTHCGNCVYLGTFSVAESFLVTDEVVAALTAHIEGKATLADLHRELGVRPTEVHDLWFCPQKGMPTVIARYGDEGHEYKSGLIFADGTDPELTKAAELARALGLIPICGVTDKDDEEWDG